MTKRNFLFFIQVVVILLLSVLLIITNYKSQKNNTKILNVNYIASIDSIKTVVASMKQVIQNQPLRTTLNQLQPIEFFDLITLFAPQENLNYNLFNWKTEANNPAINWLTNGIESDTDGFYREGNVVISINKNVIECLDRNTYPCEWGIILLGPHGGYTSFEISSVQSQALEKLDINELFKGCKFEAKIIRTNEFNNKTYWVKFPQKKPIEMSVNWSCGSGGCSLSLKCEML